MDKDGRLFQLDSSFFRSLNSVKLVDDFVPILIVFVVRVNQLGWDHLDFYFDFNLEAA